MSKRTDKWEFAVQACEYIPLTELIPKGWESWMWEVISDNAPFSWGDNNRTLVRAGRIADHVESTLENNSDFCAADGMLLPKYRTWLRDVRALGETYIDLEN
jgi:hypothetical protein